jgi:hypothetical protein
MGFNEFAGFGNFAHHVFCDALSCGVNPGDRACEPHSLLFGRKIIEIGF